MTVNSRNQGMAVWKTRERENPNMEIIMDNRKFEVVDFVPAGYEIWNIGHNMIDGYLPLCRMAFSAFFRAHAR